MQKEVSFTEDFIGFEYTAIPLSLPSRPSQPENGLTNDDESSRVLSRGVEHICLEAGCRVVVLNPVGLSTRIHNIAHHYHGSLPFSPSPFLLSFFIIKLSFLVYPNRDGGTPFLLSSPLLSSPFIVILGPPGFGLTRR